MGHLHSLVQRHSGPVRIHRLPFAQLRRAGYQGGWTCPRYFEAHESGKELKASEERYRRIVETAREGIYIIDSEARITFANRRLSTMLGYHTEEILGRFIFDFMEEDSEALARRKFERRRLGLSDTFELKFMRKGSVCIYCLVSASPIMEDGVFQGALGILTNITCLKDIESALRSAKTFSEKIINSITDELMVVNPSTYRIVQVNDHFLARTMFQNAEEL